MIGGMMGGSMRRCDHFEGVIATRTSTGLPDISIGGCAVGDVCVDTAADLARMPGSSAAVCQGCKLFAEKPDADVAYLVCPYRGQATGRQVKANGCGCDRRIFACELKGLCLKRLPAGKKLESFGDQLDGVTICKGCEVPRGDFLCSKLSTETGARTAATRQ